MDKQYLGDSVYVQHDGLRVWLTTENGLPSDPSNKICMEPFVFEALNEYVECFQKKALPLQGKKEENSET